MSGQGAPRAKEMVDRAKVERLREDLRKRSEACEAATHVLHLIGGHRKAVNDLFLAARIYQHLGNEVGVDLLDEVPF